MKNLLLFTLFCSLIFSTFGQIYTSSERWEEGGDYRDGPYHDDPYHDDYIHEYSHKIQIALVLDVSGSMDGLIEQAKSQLWNVVNAIMFDESSQGYPQIEIAVMEYGNSRLGRSRGYMRILLPFTSDLDWVAEELFSLRTGGNREYGPMAVEKSVRQLNWSYNRQDLRLLYIAGNEDFHQGYTNYREVAREARRKDIAVNTIFCGDYYIGVRKGWEDAAHLTGGDYLNIEQNYRPHYYDNRYGDQLYKLNVQLNQTYIPYGNRGSYCYNRQRDLDRRAGSYGRGYASQRYITKSTGAYLNPEWDLVDAVLTGRVKLEDIPSRDLPREMQSMSIQQRRRHLQSKLRKRQEVQREMRQVGKRKIIQSQAKAEQPVHSFGNGPQKAGQAQQQSLDQAIIQSTKHQQAIKAGKARPQQSRQMDNKVSPNKRPELSPSPRPNSTRNFDPTYKPRPQVESRQQGQAKPKQTRTYPSSRTQTRSYPKPTPTPRPTSVTSRSSKTTTQPKAAPRPRHKAKSQSTKTQVTPARRPKAGSMKMRKPNNR